MRGVVPVVALFLLAGCTGAPGTEAEAEVPDESGEVPTFDVAFQLGNLTTDGFLVNLTSSLPVNETLNATWSYTVVEATNATVEVNETLQPTGNETANQTVLEGAGTGLPALLNLSLEPGNFTLHAVVSLEGYADAEGEVSFVVPAAEVIEEVDPCAGATTQEALEFSGTATGGVLGAPGGPTHSFEVVPCQTKMTIELSYLQTGGDMDVDVFDPSGAQAGGGASGSIGSEGPIVIDGPLASGEWTVEIIYFSSGPATYDLTVTFG